MKNLLFAFSFLTILFLAACETIETYTITVSGSSGGTITPAGTSSVAEGDSIVFTITPNANNAIQSIKIDGIEQPVTNKLKLKAVAANHDIRVEFIATYTINASATTGGKITPEGSITVKSGESLTLTITPSANYAIKSIKVKGIDQPIADMYEFKNIVSDSDIKVEFVSKNFLLITKAPWYLKSMEERYKENEQWYKVDLSSWYLQSWIFDSNYVLKKYNSNGEFVGGPYSWSFTEKGLMVDKRVYKEIIFNGEKEMILIESVPCDIPDIPFVDVKRTYYLK